MLAHLNSDRRRGGGLADAALASDEDPLERFLLYDVL